MSVAIRRKVKEWAKKLPGKCPKNFFKNFLTLFAIQRAQFFAKLAPREGEIP